MAAPRGDSYRGVMRRDTTGGARDGALIVAKARSAGLAIEVHAVGHATLLTCAELPRDITFNRAFDVDVRESGVAAELLERMSARRNGHPLLEILTESIGDAEQEELGVLGLKRLWSLVALEIDLSSLPAPPPTDAAVREAHRDEAASFSALAIRALGEPPAGIPHTDPLAAARFWTAVCRLGRARCFFAERDGVACAIGVLVQHGEVGLVDGAATLPEHRRHGCQSAVLAHRFRVARAEGARVAVARAASGSPSQRNLERAGMRVRRRMEVWGRP
jgi:GNAT superfamily N-acetyltransferase